MTSVADLDHAALLHQRSNVASFASEMGEAGEHVELSDGPGESMQGRHLLLQLHEELFPKVRLPSSDLLAGDQDPFLQGREPVRGEAFALGEGLLTAEVGRGLVEVGPGESRNSNRTPDCTRS